jgi:tetrapyrrole methylase family protein/MazG family protein
LPAASSFEALQDVTSHLRAPDGCPWDRALTWAKLRSSLLEETYELLAALDEDAADKVVEELGDLLLQVAMQTQIAAEAGRFRLPDVIRRIVDKLIRRHPHVFGDTVVSGTDEVLANWEAIKAAERVKNGEQRSPLAGVPSGLPALAQADAYLDRMSRLQATDAPEAPWAPLTDLPPSAELAPDLVGEVLFGMVAWARARGVDAESALRKANARYAAHIAGDELSRANTPG